MKTKTIKLFGIIIMLVMGMSFNACSSDDDDDDDGGGSGQKGNIVGNWYFTEPGYSLLISFYSNGTFKHQDLEGGIETFNGIWRWADGDLVMEYDYGEVEYIYVRWINLNEIEFCPHDGKDECILKRVSFSTFPESEVESTDYSKVISGHWMNIGTSDNIHETLSINYKGAGTIHYYDLVDQDWGVTATGTYTLSKDILSIRYTNVEVVDSDYEPTTYHGFTDGKSKNVKYTILSCDGEMLILKNESGKTLSFEKYADIN